MDLNRELREPTRLIVVVTAWAALVIFPVLQFLEQGLGLIGGEFQDQHALLRGAVVLTALVIVGLNQWRREGDWPRPASIMLALVLVSVGWGMLLLHYAAASPYVHYISQALSISLPVAALLAVAGPRDLIWIYLLPLLMVGALFFWLATPVLEAARYVVYPLLAMVVGVIIATLLYYERLKTVQARAALEKTAMTDPLTGLFNRRAMDGVLRSEHARARRHGDTYAVVMADLDRFKRVNDTWGHDVGDEVLVELSRRLVEAVRSEDMVARWGGEEFLLLLQGASAGAAVPVAEKIRVAVAARPFKTSAGDIAITISLGVAVSDDEPAFEPVITRADEALYEAKQTGRNKVVLK